MSNYYVTTPIYYVNDVPHLGHAYTTMAADAFARFHRQLGDTTWFLTGTDEHGQKIEQTAAKRGLTAQQLTDEVAPRFAECWRRLGIENDDFIRTTEPRHRRVVAELWRKVADAGDLYLNAYEGWYCVGCEEFYTESQLVKTDAGWDCAIHKRPVDWVAKERSWFFRMSKYAEPLLAHIKANPQFIQPDNYRNEVVSFIESGLRDLSVSRTSFAWGIPAPDPDPEGNAHVIYVWMDALTNYLSGLAERPGQEPTDLATAAHSALWKNSVHLIGKDILRFHAVYWPCFLLSAGLPLPAQVFVHGWWAVRGQKISKSLPATRIDPVVVAEELGKLSPLGAAIGVDALRYYLLREVPLGRDGDFTFESLFGRYNAELANDLGNLVNRALTLIGSFGFGTPEEHKIPFPGDIASWGPEHAQLRTVTQAVLADAHAAMLVHAPHKALEATWLLVREGNKYVDTTQPWKLAKDPARATELSHALHGLLVTLRTIARLINAVLPTTSKAILGWLGDHGPVTWPSADELAAPWTLGRPATHQALFPRFDDKTQQEIIGRLVPVEEGAEETTKTVASPSPSPSKAKVVPTTTSTTTFTETTTSTTTSTVSFAEFSKTEIRVGLIVSAVAVPKAKKLLHLAVDLGEAQPRSIVAGLAEAFAPEALVGKRVLVVANLEPATIRGVRSEGMVLAVGDEAILGLSTSDTDVPPGTRVR